MLITVTLGYMQHTPLEYVDHWAHNRLIIFGSSICYFTLGVLYKYFSGFLYPLYFIINSPTHTVHFCVFYLKSFKGVSHTLIGSLNYILLSFYQFIYYHSEKNKNFINNIKNISFILLSHSDILKKETTPLVIPHLHSVISPLSLYSIWIQ